MCSRSILHDCVSFVLHIVSNFEFESLTFLYANSTLLDFVQNNIIYFAINIRTIVIFTFLLSLYVKCLRSRIEFFCFSFYVRSSSLGGYVYELYNYLYLFQATLGHSLYIAALVFFCSLNIKSK